MSLTHLQVRNFQSLKQVDLDLGLFTVIVGPSSSGKSALIRAIKALASNVRGTGMITRGQKQLAITATVDPGVKVTLERGDRASAYRLSDGEQQLSFTKLAGEVPEHITGALRLDPGADSINFAGQFDKPYLLDESGATVARQLGELTKVTTLFEAVRAANRIRASALTTLRTRTSDLAGVRTDLAGFTGLSERLKAFTLAEALDGQRKALQGRLGRLETAIRTLRVTETALVKYQPLDLPDTTPLDAVLGRVYDLRSFTSRYAAARMRETTADEQLRAAHSNVAALETFVKQKLDEAGVCPTCGQKIEH